jgi:hypothetical protein
MDVESLKTITTAEDHGKDDVAALEDKGSALITGDLNAAAVQFANVLNAALLVIQSTAEKAFQDLQATIAALDGWTLTIAPITITLRKPKE